jgi:flavin-dependent dehydrogenase
VSFGGRWGYTARRAELDQALRDAAARLVEVHHRTRALAIDSRADGHVVSAVRSDGRPMDIRVDAVCIATGGTGTFSRDLGIDGEPLAAVSVSAYVGGPGSDAPRFELHDSCRPGYRWSFPMADGRRNVGLCLLGGSAAGIRAVADSFVAETPGLATPRWRGGREPLWSGRGRRWHAPNGIVSCGDAAGLVDPANGEGITAAVESGARAGESIAAYLTGGRRDIPLQQYSDWVRGSFEDRYASTPVRAVWRSMAGIGG